MKYLLEPTGTTTSASSITDCYVACVALHDARWHIENVECEEIAVVTSLDDAIPALVVYYEKTPPQWKRESATRYRNLTQFGLLRVEQDQPGQWLAYRNDNYPLLRNGQPAIFATSEDYPNSETILRWLCISPR